MTQGDRRLRAYGLFVVTSLATAALVAGLLAPTKGLDVRKPPPLELDEPPVQITPKGK